MATAEEDDYFALNPAPPILASHLNIAQSFINHHVSQHRRVVLVTSGGTTVPLENQTVRFIDNFSAGTRGATSAEYFLQAGYAVIFLHRQFSLLPYSRHYSHSTNCFLDFVQESTYTNVNPDSSAAASYSPDAGPLVISQEYQSHMRAVLRQYQHAKRERMLVLLPFTTITEYMWSLRSIAHALKPLGSDALLYLAAAVSDFFVPNDRMVEHKIQASGEFAVETPDGSAPAARMHEKSLVIDLDPVPKFLKRLVDGWAPEGMIISFKLETDSSILGAKARDALQKYAHHLVIGNLLSTRKVEVLFVSNVGNEVREEWVRLPAQSTQMMVNKGHDHVEEDLASGANATQKEKDPNVEIESIIIPKVKKLHDEFIITKQRSGSQGFITAFGLI